MAPDSSTGNGANDGQEDTTHEGETVPHFTSGLRPLLVVLLQDPAGGPLAHDVDYYYDRLFMTGDGNRCVQEYYWHMSRNNFDFMSAGFISVVDNTSVNAAAGVIGKDDANEQKRKRARYFAAQNGFNFAAFDSNHDGRVTTDELTILVIDNYSDGGGQTNKTACTTVTSKKVKISECSAVSLVGHRSGMMNFAHELSHTLDPTSQDLYGASCLNGGATLMDCTGGTHEDDTSATFLDPWHREMYGWLGPSHVGSMDSFEYGQIVSGVNNPWGEQEVVTVQSHFGSQAITFELRGLYDAYDDQGSGLYAWWSDLSGGAPFEIASLTAGGTDASMDVLGPVGSCELDPMDPNSRGVVSGLGVGQYLVHWSDGSAPTQFYIDRVDFDDGTYYYTVGWDTAVSDRTCP